jgi:hypothetical protein
VCAQAEVPTVEEAVPAQRPHRKLITDGAGAARRQAVPAGARKQAARARAKKVAVQPPPAPVEEEEEEVEAAEEEVVAHEDDSDDVSARGEVPSSRVERRREVEEEERAVAAREEAASPPAPLPVRHVRPRPQRDDVPPARGVYRFTARGIDGETRPLGEFAGQARAADGTCTRTRTNADSVPTC